MREAQYRAMKSVAALVGLPKSLRTDAQTLSGNLNVDCMLGAVVSEHDSQAGHAFASDDADLDAGLIGAVGNDGGEAGF